MWIFFQPNPCFRSVEDCNVRALSAVLDIDWEQAFDMLASSAKKMCDMPHGAGVLGAVLRMHGFRKVVIPNTCPTCYTVRNFCQDNPKGVYVLCLSSHVTAIIDGNIYDSWDTSNEIPVYTWYKEDEHYGI